MNGAENNRRYPRHEFRYEQLLAGLKDGKMPSLADFAKLPCEDISCGGIAFYMNNEPEFDRYLVGLGEGAHVTYLCARVAHTQQTLHKGQLSYRVGLQFTGRARLDRSTMSLFLGTDRSSAPGEYNTEEKDTQMQTSPAESGSQEAGADNTEVARQSSDENT